MASSSSTLRLQLVAITLPPGPFGVRFQKRDGMCVVVSKTNAVSPLKVHDTIVSLNGIKLKEGERGVDVWIKLFRVFETEERNLIVQRATRHPVASLRSHEGHSEIASAKRRLATAVSWKKSTSEAIKLAQNQLALARTQFEASQNEVEEAEVYLEDVNKRWEVIDVDEEVDVCEGDSDGKRNREVSLSPDHGRAKKAHTDAAVDYDTYVDQLMVEGAGVSEVNGLYKRCQSNNILTLSHDSNAPMYSKRGSWNGDEVDFFICQRAFLTYGVYVAKKTQGGVQGSTVATVITIFYHPNLIG